MSKLLVIGFTWPEPQRTAAGYRMMQLLNMFQEMGHEVVFCCAARLLERHENYLAALKIKPRRISLTDDSLDQVLAGFNPQLVMYDRYLIEEQYGWKVREYDHKIIQILDTEDLHCLRHAREQELIHGVDINVALTDTIALREISSIMRCQLTLIISRYEMKLLHDFYEVPSHLLLHVPFLCKKETIDDASEKLVGFNDRRDYCAIGNFKHAPNMDAVRQLKYYIWPAIRKLDPNVHLYIYGANPTAEAMAMHHPDDHFHIRAQTPDIHKVLSTHRVMLAPLRFGAGLKGKLYDALLNGLPTVMTPIAAESMYVENFMPGVVVDDLDQFATAAVSLYRDGTRWNLYQQYSSFNLNTLYEDTAFAKSVQLKINDLQRDPSSNAQTFIHEMLSYHGQEHFKFKGYWIRLKNGAKSS
ncbi:glycosyltransferase [Nonlabens ponticola]|uniref:Glycosyltransferase n=1 Tax=Nonlabens ponticola TaxID=2496866 RepID=A0A3S9MYE7_9FLAO|nr:glycosyltransferase family 4 protein [Nonlabens ponticola]AZQ44271.1 glycosyltransferase [Nonlabens ponticola]